MAQIAIDKTVRLGYASPMDFGGEVPASRVCHRRLNLDEHINAGQSSRLASLVRAALPIVLFLGLCVSAQSVAADASSVQVTLAWDPPRDRLGRVPADLVSYKVHYGHRYRNYFASERTSDRCHTLSLSAGPTYHFAVTAVYADHAESAYSEDVVWDSTRAGDILSAGYAGIRLLRLQAPFPNQWVAVNIWDERTGWWVLPQPRIVFDLSAVEVCNLDGGSWYTVSIWSFAESRWHGTAVNLRSGSCGSASTPTVTSYSGAPNGASGVLVVDELILQCTKDQGGGWVATGLWSDADQRWLDPLTDRFEPQTVATSVRDLNAWYWAGMWHYRSGAWAPGSWIGLFQF